MKNAFSIDLEDWYHPELVQRYLRGNFKPQIFDATVRILDLLDKYNVKATFFVVGDVAKKSPEIIRLIYAKGHEIAFHGMNHEPLWTLSYKMFGKILKKFKELIRSILGEEVQIKGFRAPSASIDQRTGHYLQCLVDNDFEWDSSIFPFKTPLYGIADAPLKIYYPDFNNILLEGSQKDLIEFPLTVFNVGPIRFPITGGVYIKILPYIITKFLLKQVNQRFHRPFVLYFHPWETYTKTPRVRQMGLVNSIITYFGNSNYLKKIDALLRDFEFDTISEVIAKYRM